VTKWGIWVVAFLACAVAAPAATVWKESRAKVDEVVADTTDLAPPSPLTPLAAQIPFKNFRYPFVDPNETVTFIADDPVYGGTRASHGIYRSYAGSGRLETLVRAGETTVPGQNARFTLIRGLHVAENGLDFVFNAIDSDGKRGLYHWRNGALRMIARSGETVLPGDTAPLEDVDWASVRDGKTLFVASTAAGRELALQDLATGRNETLLRVGQKIPGTDERFLYFSPQNWTDGRSIVFRAARVPDPHSTEGATRGIYAWLGGDHSLASLRTLADWKTPVPDAPGNTFTDISSAPVRGHLVAFQAVTESRSGVYWMDTRTGESHVVVDTETEMPGLFSGAFHSFNIYTVVVDEDTLAFVAHAGNYAGVFLYKPGKDELFVLADSRSPVGGKVVSDYEISSQFLVRNRLVVTAKFTDRSSGVYLATIPPGGYRRDAAE
jgi:hypothetical protein